MCAGTINIYLFYLFIYLIIAIYISTPRGWPYSWHSCFVRFSHKILGVLNRKRIRQKCWQKLSLLLFGGWNWITHYSLRPRMIWRKGWIEHKIFSEMDDLEKLLIIWFRSHKTIHPVCSNNPFRSILLILFLKTIPFLSL